MDRLTPQQRHYNMAAIQGRDTKPEMVVLKYRAHLPKNQTQQSQMAKLNPPNDQMKIYQMTK